MLNLHGRPAKFFVREWREWRGWLGTSGNEPQDREMNPNPTTTAHNSNATVHPHGYETPNGSANPSEGEHSSPLPRHRAARTGKIARLPLVIRQRLNERLADGEPHKVLVAWLNEHEVVRMRLLDSHGGRPITEQNLSDWKAGGFRDWERHQETRGILRGFLSEAEQLSEELGEEELLECATNSVALALLRLFQEALLAEPGPEQRQAVLQLSRELNRMRRVEHERQRVLLLVEKAHKPSDKPPEYPMPCDIPMSWEQINQRLEEGRKEAKKENAWLRAESEALRAEYVIGMESRALSPERRKYIEAFYEEHALDMQGLYIRELPRWKEPKAPCSTKRAAPARTKTAVASAAKRKAAASDPAPAADAPTTGTQPTSEHGQATSGNPE